MNIFSHSFRSELGNKFSVSLSLGTLPLIPRKGTDQIVIQTWPKLRDYMLLLGVIQRGPLCNAGVTEGTVPTALTRITEMPSAACVEDGQCSCPARLAECHHQEVPKWYRKLDRGTNGRD